MKTTITKAFITLAAIAAISAPALVNAQPMPQHGQPQQMGPQHTDPHGQPNRPAPKDSRYFDGRINDLRGRIDQASRSHRISQREARSLTSNLNSIASLKRSYDRHGLTSKEVSTLDFKLDTLSNQIRR